MNSGSAPSLDTREGIETGLLQTSWFGYPLVALNRPCLDGRADMGLCRTAEKHPPWDGTACVPWGVALGSRTDRVEVLENGVDDEDRAEHRLMRGVIRENGGSRLQTRSTHCVQQAVRYCHGITMDNRGYRQTQYRSEGAVALAEQIDEAVEFLHVSLSQTLSSSGHALLFRELPCVLAQSGKRK